MPLTLISSPLCDHYSEGHILQLDGFSHHWCSTAHPWVAEARVLAAVSLIEDMKMDQLQYHLVQGRGGSSPHCDRAHFYPSAQNISPQFTKLIIDLWPKVLWYKLHLWASFCLGSVDLGLCIFGTFQGVFRIPFVWPLPSDLSTMSGLLEIIIQYRARSLYLSHVSYSTVFLQ